MGILSDVDEAQCMWLLAKSLDERVSVPIIIQDNFPLSNPSFLGCHTRPRIQCVLVVHSVVKYT
jgi:hypothetical protein